MKSFSAILLFLLLCTGALAQIDRTDGLSVPIGAQEDSELPTPSIINTRPEPSTRSLLPKKDEDTEDMFSSDQKKHFDMTKDTDLLTKKFDYSPSWLTADKKFKDAYNSGEHFGSYSTYSKSIEVLCRDHQYVDGDLVALIHNGDVIVHRIYLRESFQSFIIDLEPGDNIIEFQALNQGTSGPNTAQFRVFDEYGVKIIENEWNLATGVKATLVVRRETM